jgi:hypothetical protein
MNTNFLTRARKLSDEALLTKVQTLAQGSRDVTVELIAHLAEISRRKLYRGEGPGRLFGYCTQVLRFSEAAAWNRIKAARAARAFPIILDLLSNGSVNLTTIRLLSPHLTRENHKALLAESTGMTRRQVDKLVARLKPQPDVPASIRKLPAARPIAQTAMAGQPVMTRTAPTPSPASQRPVFGALSPERYRLQITIEEDAHDDLRCLQDLMRREIPDGDPAAIVARALKLLRQDAEKKAFAATTRPRPPRDARAGSREIPAHVQRKVWTRDGGQCAFVARSGRRCTERSYIEFHHERPHADGGEPTVENMSLRCREHNEHESEIVFGPYVPHRGGRPVPPASGMPTGPGTSTLLPPRELREPEREAHI